MTTSILRSTAFYECGETFAAAGWPSCAAAYFVLSYYAASLDQLTDRTDTDELRMEALYQVANSLRRLSLQDKQFEKPTIALLLRCINHSRGDPRLWPTACDAHEALARMAMNWRKNEYAAAVLRRGLSFADEGTPKYISDLLARSYASLRARDHRASGQFLEARRALDAILLPDSGRYFGHAFFRGGISSFFDDNSECLELFRESSAAYSSSNKRSDLKMRFRGLLSISTGMAVLKFGRHHGYSLRDSNLLAEGHFSAGRILLAGDDPIPYGLGLEALEVSNSPLSARASVACERLRHSPLAGDLVRDAEAAVGRLRRSAVKQALRQAFSLVLCARELQEAWQHQMLREHVRVFFTGSGLRIDQVLLGRALPRLALAGLVAFPNQAFHAFRRVAALSSRAA